MKSKVDYLELLPGEFMQRLKECPVAYLPLGTLEWHGPHLPLGADALQAQQFFRLLAKKVGGIVMPPLFVGPDRCCENSGTEYYGMDYQNGETLTAYPTQQLPGSAYWVPDALFDELLTATGKQVARAGFKVLVAHGHGPSILAFGRLAPELKRQFGLVAFHCWQADSNETLRFMGDHAAANETSITMALFPELVDMETLQEGISSMVGMAGENPLLHANSDLGGQIVEKTLDDMEYRIREALRGMCSGT